MLKHPALEKYKIAIVSRTYGGELYVESLKFLAQLPLPFYAYTGWDAQGYLHAICSLDYDFVINIDEDAYVYDLAAMLDLIPFMAQEGYHYCGMPDGGVTQTRSDNPIVQNAFFNIFDLRDIRPKLPGIRTIEKQQFREEWKESFPANLLKEAYNWQGQDLYYPFGFWLFSQCKPLYLDAENWQEDPICSVLKNHKGKPFVLHTWYSRAYIKNEAPHVERIQYAIKQAEKLAGGHILQRELPKYAIVKRPGSMRFFRFLRKAEKDIKKLFSSK